MAFALPDKKVILTYNPKAVTAYLGKKDHDGSFRFTGTFQTWVLPQYTDGKWANIFEHGSEEKEYLEQQLDMVLDPVKKDNDLIKRRIKLDKKDPSLALLQRVLDLSNPSDYLDYLILKVQDDVIESWKPESDLKQYKWLLKEEEVERNMKISDFEFKAKATNIVVKLREHPKRMYNVLRLAGLKPSHVWSADQLYSKLVELVETDKNTTEKIVDIVEDIAKVYDAQVFIEDAVMSSVLYRSNMTYYNKATGEKIGSLVETVAFVKDAANASWVLNAQAQIKLFKTENKIQY